MVPVTFNVHALLRKAWDEYVDKRYARLSFEEFTQLLWNQLKFLDETETEVIENMKEDEFVDAAKALVILFNVFCLMDAANFNTRHGTELQRAVIKRFLHRVMENPESADPMKDWLSDADKNDPVILDIRNACVRRTNEAARQEIGRRVKRQGANEGQKELVVALMELPPERELIGTKKEGDDE